MNRLEVSVYDVDRLVGLVLYKGISVGESTCVCVLPDAFSLEIEKTIVLISHPSHKISVGHISNLDCGTHRPSGFGKLISHISAGVDKLRPVIFSDY